MLFFILAGDKNVVNVGTAEVETAEDTIDEALEGLGGIPQPERHSEEFKRARRSGNGRFWDVFGCDRYLVVCTNEVDGRENLHSCEDTVVDVWQGISVRDGVRIPGTVVTTTPPVAGFRFLDHMERRCPLAVGRADNATIHHVLEFDLSNALLRRIKAAIPLEGCWTSGVDVVGNLMWWRITGAGVVR